jgi:hypothetical protein
MTSINGEESDPLVYNVDDEHALLFRSIRTGLVAPHPEKYVYACYEPKRFLYYSIYEISKEYIIWEIYFHRRFSIIFSYSPFVLVIITRRRSE